MCHRHLSFKKSTTCGHLILTEERNIDCQDPQCYNSAVHPSDCAARSGRARAPCQCRRYYTQPIRVVQRDELQTKCPRCSTRRS
ncbi:hypothetical protein EDB84DRAFT_1458448 [Lactarius hengduanensis]|nr:hypothetical protein EDB84DRAFT_1458448 [Lactarius hengduanensis]